MVKSGRSLDCARNSNLLHMPLFCAEMHVAKVHELEEFEEQIDIDGKQRTVFYRHEKQ